MNIILYNNGLWNIYAVFNGGTIFKTYSDISELPDSMRATAKTLKSIYIGPHQANCLGIQEELYPNFPKCGLPFYDESEVHECVSESCIISSSKGYGACPFFDDKWMLVKEEPVAPEPPSPEPSTPEPSPEPPSGNNPGQSGEGTGTGQEPGTDGNGGV